MVKTLVNCSLKVLLFSLVFALVTMIFITASAEVVNFPDPKLEMVLRLHLGNPEGPITDDDLAGLSELNAYKRDISNLSGIERCVNLEALDLSGNKISDINSLRELIDLRHLFLMYNQIRDVSPLSGLFKLETLGLGSNQLRDINVLSGLTNLSILDLSDNQILDISPLVRNTGLKGDDFVILAGNPLDDEAYKSHIPTLTERGVYLEFDPQPVPEGAFRDPNLEAAIRKALYKPEG